VVKCFFQVDFNRIAHFAGKMVLLTAMKRLLLSITMITAICSSNGQADIYRYDGDDEVVTFTDNPGDKRYHLVMKEQQQRSTGKAGKKQQPAAVKEEGKSAQPAGQESLTRTLPIDGVITSQAGLRTDPFDGKLRHHNGLDIAAPSGTPVKPVASGTVIFSGWKSGYGNTVIVDHGDGMKTVYAHHSSNSVGFGDSVDTGSVIALSGSTGRSTGPHLHFEAWQGDANITNDFMPGHSGGSPSSPLHAPIRRFLQEDGTILFTNLR
jgi:murein DD-endopeptidase MepM/ murein hydrolase activator NlpD